MNKTTATIAALVLALSAAACGGSDATQATTTAPTTGPTTAEAPIATEAPPTSEAVPSSEVAPTTEPEAVDTQLRQPLTGVPVESADDLISRPALVVKIDNNAKARPNHSGLAVADIVFEEIVETGSRFAAVFQTQDSDPVGPIRSGREQDVSLLSPFNRPLFGWSGGNPGVTALIRDSVLTDLNPSGAGRGAYYRGNGSAPHNFYSSTQALYALTPADHPGAPAQQFEYVLPDTEFEGDAVSQFEVDLDGSLARWEWDAEASGWARFQNGTRHTDVVHGDIFAKNVIVLAVDYVPSTIDRNAPDAQSVGSGPLMVFSNGSAVTGRWERASDADSFVFTDDDGEPIALTPGNTWIELAANTGGVSFTTGEGEPLDPAAPSIDLADPASFPTAITVTQG